jgi:hypothetical protein
LHDKLVRQRRCVGLSPVAFLLRLLPGEHLLEHFLPPRDLGFGEYCGLGFRASHRLHGIVWGEMTVEARATESVRDAGADGVGRVV